MPQSVENSLTGAYLAPNTFLNKRDIRKKIFDKYHEHNLFDFLYHSNRKKKTDNTTFNWWEHTYLFNNAIIASFTGSGAGNPITITLKAGSYQNGGKLSAPKKGDTVMVGGLRGWIQSVNKATDNAHTITVKPVNSADNLSAVAAADGLVTIYGDGKADGTGMPSSMLRLPEMYDNDTQILATYFETDGSVAANKAEVTIPGKGDYYYLQGVVDAANMHNLKIEFTLILGQRAVGLSDSTEDNKEVTLTHGLDKFITDDGNLEPYTTFAFADLENIEKTLSKERAPKEVAMANGINLNLGLEAVLRDTMKDTGISYAAFGKGNGKERAIDFGFDSFRHNSRSYHNREFEALNYEPVTGSTGFPDVGYVIPMGQVKNAKPTGMDDEYMDMISLRYKENDRENRFIKHWTRDQTITNKDAFEFCHQSEFGLQAGGLNQFIKVHK